MHLQAEPFPKLQLYECANLIALYSDHFYTKKHINKIFLEDMNLKTIDPDKKMEIESSTRGQSKNGLQKENCA